MASPATLAATLTELKDQREKVKLLEDECRAKEQRWLDAESERQESKAKASWDASKALLTAAQEELAALRRKEEILLGQLSSAEQDGAAGPSSFEQLKRRLEDINTDPRGINDAVIRKIVNLHGAGLQFADNVVLKDWYKQIQSSPQTCTQIEIEDQYGLSFDGYFAANPSRGALLYAFHRDTGKPVLVKFGQEPGIIRREFASMERAANAPHIPRPIRKIIPDSTSRASMPTKAGFVKVNTSMGIQMPLYPATLAHIKPPMTTELILKLGKQVLECLDHIHDLDDPLVHNDIKATNIFITSEGDAIVGDWGAAKDMGKTPPEMTATHWCKDGPKVGCRQTDRMQLLITLLERLNLYPGYTPTASIGMIASLVEKVKDTELQAFLQSLLE